uniref:Uncharacterized protein n=1 Tax=Kalanchoe fedtschenkoi TaxID=63787 RepID=A0A7N0VCW9_KALFE
MEWKIIVTSFFLAIPLGIVMANSVVPQPQSNASFTLNYIENVGSCSFTVVITTSCSSTSYTRDQISLAFGDAYGNQVYAPRLDDPSTGTFERCSSDTFQVKGPCTYQICYAYFYRSGYDGWKPESVTISGYNTRAVTFFIRTFIPADTWYGVNLCSSASSGHQNPVIKWFSYAFVGPLFAVFL